MAMIDLTPEESRILRRELPAVAGLISKGLIDSSGALTAAGQQWITDYTEAVRQSRAAGGGHRNIGPRKRKQIARKAAQAKYSKKK